MIFIFTTSNKIGSRLIRWGLNSDVSHFAIAETNVYDAFVLDSTLEENVSVKKLNDFQRSHQIVYAFESNTLDFKTSQSLFTKVYSELKNKKYDYKGIAWLGLTVLFCKKLFGRPLPKSNQWADTDDFFCSEIANILKKELLLFCNIDLLEYNQMLTPDILLKMFLRAEQEGYVKQVYILSSPRLGK
jgi:hypothetical protein